MSLITDPTRVEHEMAADRTPTPAPASCPACGAAITLTWKSESGQSDFIEFECGLELANQSGNPGWKVRFNSRCRNFQNDPLRFAAAVALRAELAASKRYADHLEHESAALSVLHSNAVDERDTLTASLARVTNVYDTLQYTALELFGLQSKLRRGQAITADELLAIYKQIESQYPDIGKPALRYSIDAAPTRKPRKAGKR